MEKKEKRKFFYLDYVCLFVGFQINISIIQNPSRR